MANRQLGRTIIIANPVSHSGQGACAIERVQRFFEAYASVTSSFELRLTSMPGEATILASEAARTGTDTLVALGGDGVIHEVVNGLMTVPKQSRPRLGIIPVGSGNDFARTIHVTHNHPETSLTELLTGPIVPIDLGHVSSNLAVATYFVETLSFGTDAAIALDTTNRRARGTRQKGEALFATSAIHAVTSGVHVVPVIYAFDDGDSRRVDSIMFAIQIGPTYGGGFRICPDASPVDGRLSICHNVRRGHTPHLLILLGLARFGLHTRSRILELRDCERLSISFPEEAPPCQVDGERLLGSRFQVSCVPHALDVITGPGTPWQNA